MKWTWLLLFGLSTSLLSACSEHRARSYLENYTAQVQAKKVQPPEPLPVYKPYEDYAYAAENLRSPFEPVSRDGRGGPNANRPKEILENYPLDSLRFVGTMQEGKDAWGLITAPDGSVYRISVGNYIGQNYGQVTHITADSLTLVEMIPNGDGWRPHPVTLMIRNTDNESSAGDS
jgi:type IV pilus assembly protein PilP